MGIRSTAKAIIVDNKKVLLNKCYDEYYGEYYSLPGGGQNIDETLEEAIVRECLEETGYNVLPIRFSALFEEICEDERVRTMYPEYIHKMYHIFLCKLRNYTRVEPSEIDDEQVGSEWVEIKNLINIKIQPDCLNDTIIKLIEEDRPLFLGSKHIKYNHG